MEKMRGQHLVDQVLRNLRGTGKREEADVALHQAEAAGVVVLATRVVDLGKRGLKLPTVIVCCGFIHFCCVGECCFYELKQNRMSQSNPSLGCLRYPFIPALCF